MSLIKIRSHNHQSRRWVKKITSLSCCSWVRVCGKERKNECVEMREEMQRKRRLVTKEKQNHHHFLLKSFSGFDTQILLSAESHIRWFLYYFWGVDSFLCFRFVLQKGKLALSVSRISLAHRFVQWEIFCHFTVDDTIKKITRKFSKLPAWSFTYFCVY